MRVARTAGHTDATSVTSVPVSIATTAVRALEDHRGLRHVEVDRPEERGEALREQDAEPEADGRGDDAEDGALEHDRAEHLAARGAERPQRRELLRSLRDRDRERVEDDEGADEQGDSAEGEQEVANERDELAHALSVLGGLLGAGLHHGRLRQHPLDRVEQLRLPDAVARPHGDGVEAGFPEHLARRRDVEDRDRGAAEAVDVAEASNARERVRAHRALAGDLDLLADVEALALCGRDVDHDLVRACGPVARDELERVEALVCGVDAEAEGGIRALDGLAVAVEDLRLVRVAGEIEDRPRRSLDLRQRADTLEHLRRDGRPARLRPLDELGPGDDCVRLLVGAREDRVERPLDRVGEDERAADHRDAEHDRDRRQRRAKLAGHEPAERDSLH